MTANWIIFILSSLALIGVGFWSQMKIKKGPSGSSEGFLLGAKSIGAFVGAGTLMATGYSGWGFIGSPGTAYAYGAIEVFANFFFAPAITFGTLFFAGFMKRRSAAGRQRRWRRSWILQKCWTASRGNCPAGRNSGWRLDVPLSVSPECS